MGAARHEEGRCSPDPGCLSRRVLRARRLTPVVLASCGLSYASKGAAEGLGSAAGARVASTGFCAPADERHRRVGRGGPVLANGSCGVEGSCGGLPVEGSGRPNRTICACPKPVPGPTSGQLDSSVGRGGVPAGEAIGGGQVELGIGARAGLTAPHDS